MKAENYCKKLKNRKTWEFNFILFLNVSGLMKLYILYIEYTELTVSNKEFRIHDV